MSRGHSDTVQTLTKSESIIEQKPGVYPIDMWTPRINGTPIETAEQLEDIIESKLSGFSERKDYPEFLRKAKLHLELYLEYHERGFLRRGEVRAISKRTGESPTTIKRWLREGVKPRLYHFLDLVSVDDRVERVRQIQAGLNGVLDMEEQEERFETLYFYDEISSRPSYEQNQEYSEKFFRFMQMYTRGEMIPDIVRKLEIGKTTITEWIHNSILPTNMKFASLIPAKTLPSGKKWLPFLWNHILNIPEQFILVPERITSFQDLLEVLEQIPFQKTREMEEYEREFGEMPRHIALMYLLGAIISDGTFKFDAEWSASVKLFASKKYVWSKDFGRGFCYTLGMVGISAEQKADSIRVRHGKVQVCRVWSSQASPFLMWMKKALLGLENTSQKSTNSIDAEWILEMPRDWRIALVQGLADGDGYASIGAFAAGIATIINQSFFKRLLTSLGIETAIDCNKIKTRKHEEILKVKELPLFRHALGRQQGLDDLCEVIRALDRSHGRVPVEQIRIIMDLHRNGYKCGQIAEILWYQFRFARSTKSIDKIIRRYSKKENYSSR